MAPRTVAAVIERALARFVPAADLEITLEANPTSVEAGRLAGFRAAGVNRVSLGVQALDDAALRFLGREHSAAEALAAVALAARLFSRFSFDLIYGRPGQTVEAWQSELVQALGLADGHLSVYQLTIEPGTRFDLLQRTGALAMPDDDLLAELYELTQERLAAADLPALRNLQSRSSGRGVQAQSDLRRSGEWLGVGPGAHGRLNGSRRARRDRSVAPTQGLARAGGAGRIGQAWPHFADAAEQVEELLVMGLRLSEGVDVARLTRTAGRPLRAVARSDRARALRRRWLADCQGGRLAATNAGRQRLNAILGELLPIRSISSRVEKRVRARD